MDPDSRDMTSRRDLDVLLFAVREGDMRLASLIAAALHRERLWAPLAAGPPVPAAPPRAHGEPSPLARRALGAVLARLGLDQPGE